MTNVVSLDSFELVRKRGWRRYSTRPTRPATRTDILTGIARDISRRIASQCSAYLPVDQVTRESKEHSPALDSADRWANPYSRFLWRVLSQAIWDYFVAPDSHRVTGESSYDRNKAAERWERVESAEYLLFVEGLEAYCDLLGLNTEYVRGLVLGALDVLPCARMWTERPFRLPSESAIRW